LFKRQSRHDVKKYEFVNSEYTQFNVPLDTIGHFGDTSFQTISCTGTDNQKQGNNTLHTPET